MECGLVDERARRIHVRHDLSNIDKSRSARNKKNLNKINVFIYRFKCVASLVLNTRNTINAKGAATEENRE